MATTRADYGIDAPAVLRTLAIVGIIFLLIAACSCLRPSRASTTLAITCLWPGLWCLLASLWMYAGSRWGKLRLRDALLAQLALRGDERVLDVGCGHGLLLLGAAKLLPRGRAVGIDLWSQADQAGNSRAATLTNAQREGVSERVEIHDGDMRALPFPDASFDVVMASLSIHNIPTTSERARAVREIARVLKPHGRVALLDIRGVTEIVSTLRDLGWKDIRRSPPSFFTCPPSRTVFATKPGP